MPEFLVETARLFRIVTDCRAVLFRRRFRELLPSAVEAAVRQLEHLADDLERKSLPGDFHTYLHAAGLDGASLELKLEAFESAVIRFETDGGRKSLRAALERASVLIDSLAGAIPMVGPLAKELLTLFILELDDPA